MAEHYADIVPSEEELTEYDRTHLKLYLRLLDATAEGTDWQEIARVLFGIDPVHQPKRAHSVYSSHLARARWMAQKGYLLLLRQARN